MSLLARLLNLAAWHLAGPEPAEPGCQAASITVISTARERKVA